jgi:hypothetical protein
LNPNWQEAKASIDARLFCFAFDGLAESCSLFSPQISAVGRIVAGTAGPYDGERVQGRTWLEKIARCARERGGG